jgi:hypothetical protein
MAGDGDNDDVRSKKSDPPEQTGQERPEEKSPEQDRADKEIQAKEGAKGEFQKEVNDERDIEAQRKTGEVKRPTEPQEGKIDTVTGKVDDGNADSKDKTEDIGAPAEAEAKDPKTAEKPNQKSGKRDTRQLDLQTGKITDPATPEQQPGTTGDTTNAPKDKQPGTPGDSTVTNSVDAPKDPHQVKPGDSTATNSAEAPKDPKQETPGDSTVTDSADAPKDPQQATPGDSTVTNSADAPKDPQQLTPGDSTITNAADAPKNPQQAAPGDSTVTNSADAPKDPQQATPGDSAVTNSADAPKDPQQVTAGDSTITDSADAPKDPKQAIPADSTVTNSADAPKDPQQATPGDTTTVNSTNNPPKDAQPVTPVAANNATRSFNTFSSPNPSPERNITANPTSSFDSRPNLSTNSFTAGRPLPEVQNVRTVNTNEGTATAQPQGDRTASRQDGPTAPQVDQTAPKAELTAPQGDQTSPQGDQTKPQGDQTTPQGDQTTPQGDQTAPQGDQTKPQGDQTTSQGDQTKPQGDQTKPQGDQTKPQGDQTKPQGDQTKPQNEQITPQGERPTTNQPNPPRDQNFAGLFSPESLATSPQTLQRPETQAPPNDTSPGGTQTTPEQTNQPITPTVVRTERTQVQGDIPGSTPIVQSNTFQPTPESQRDVPITTVNTVNANDRLPQTTTGDTTSPQNAGDNTSVQPQQQQAPMNDLMFNPQPVAQQQHELQSSNSGSTEQQGPNGSAQTNSAFFDSTPIAEQSTPLSGGGPQSHDAHQQGPTGSAGGNNDLFFNPTPLESQSQNGFDQSGAGSAGPGTMEARPASTESYHEQVGGPSLGNDGPSSGGFTPHNEPLSQNVTTLDTHPTTDYGPTGEHGFGGKDTGYNLMDPTPMAEQGGHGASGTSYGDHALAESGSTHGGPTPSDGAHADGLSSGRPGETQGGELASLSDSHGGTSTGTAGGESGSRSAAGQSGSDVESTFSRPSTDLASNHNATASHEPASSQNYDKPNSNNGSAITAGDTNKSDIKSGDIASKATESSDKSNSATPTLEKNVTERSAQALASDANNRPNVVASTGKESNEGSNTTQQERMQRIENLARMAQAFVSMDAPKSPGQVSVSDNQNGKSSFPQGSNIALARNSTGSVVGTPGELARSTVDGAKAITDRLAGAVSMSTLSAKGTEGILGLSALHGQINRVGADGRLLGNPGQFSALTNGKGLFGDNRTFRGIGTDGFNNNVSQGGRVRFDGRVGALGSRVPGSDPRGVRGSGFDPLVGPLGIGSTTKLPDRSLTFKNGRLDFSSGGKRYLTGVEIALAAALAAAAIAKKRPEDQLNDEDLAQGQLSELLGDKENDGQEQKDTKSTKDSTLARQSVPTANLFKRPLHLVQPNESLISIAEDYFNDSDVAWLIADINATNIIQHYDEGKRIIELRSRQEIQLPLPSEITDFFASKSKDHRGDLIVTIIAESQVDTELLNNFLGTVVGVAQSAQTPEHSIGAPALVPAMNELPQASFHDDTLSAIRNFGKAIMPTVHALLDSGKNLRTFISRVDEVPPTPTSPPALKAVEKDKITA